jgi:heat-inducible transcriptional repressor
MSLDDRKAQLLRAVVHDFIQQAKPVGSKTLADRYALGLSAATIRNELAALEEQGYLSHPHTSAGRVPTDRGYRFYVDSLSGVGKLARAQEEAIARYFEGAADLEETMRRTSVLLARISQHTAMVAPPSLDRSRLRHIELVGLGRHVVMIVIIVDTGRVEKRLVESTFEVAASDLDDMRRRFLDALVGERLVRAELVLGGLGEQIPPERQALFDLLADAVGQMVSDQTSERVFIGGQAHLAGPDAFDGLEAVHRVYEALEQQVLVLRLLRAVLDSDEQLSVTIGSENTIAGIEACSLVTSAYGTGAMAGSIGVIGPTRMDYLRAMAAVQAVARYLGDVLDDG